MAETYGRYNVPELWKSVAGEDPEAGFNHINILKRMVTAVEYQRDSLRVHRDRLFEGWPPDRSEAAAAFVAQLNGLIEIMSSTAVATGRICAGVDETYAALRDVRRLLEPLAAAYDGDGRSDQRAREAFVAADAKIVNASPMLNASLPGRLGKDDTRTILQDGESGTGGAGERRPGPGRSPQTAMLPAPVFDPPAVSGPEGERPTPDVTTGGEDPILAGAPGAPGGVSGISQPGVISPPGAVGPGPVPGPVRPPYARTDGFAVTPGGVIGPPRPASAAGGYPGGIPATGAVPRAARRPVPGRRAGASADPSPPRGSGSAAGGYRDRSYESYLDRSRAKRADGDEAWMVEEGVAPVIERSAEPRHDPGPGVIGIDR